MKTLTYGVLVASVIVATGAGCARRAPVVQKQVRRTAPAEVQWGPAAEGLQCRVRPARRVYTAGESPAFKIDLCNRGGRVFAFVRSGLPPVQEFSIDGRRRWWPDRPPTDGKIRAFGRGAEALDMPATLPADAQSLLTPGPHVVQFFFVFEGVEVVSNPVQIEIIGR